MQQMKIYIFNALCVLFFSGCVSEIMLLGTVVSVVATTQEVEEDHNGNLWDYITDKYDSLKSYVGKKLN